MQGDASGFENTRHMLYGSMNAIDVFEKRTR